MIQYEGIATAADAIRLLVLTSLDTLPPALVERLQPLTGTGFSPVDLGVQFTESVYANKRRQGVTKAMREAAAGFAVLADQYGFDGKLKGRAPGIAAALSRENNEPGTWPDASDDPAVADGYDIKAAKVPLQVPAPGGAAA